MLEAIYDVIQSPDLWKYLSIPLVCGIVGWGTNVLALHMMFYPLEPFGKPPFLGWQGIVPAKVQKMAEIFVETMTSKLISVEDVFSKMDPNRVADELEPALLYVMEPMVEDIMMEHVPVFWEALPNVAKNEIYRRSRKEIPRVVSSIMRDIKTRINDIFDLKAMVVNALVRNKPLVNDMFQTIAEKEFQFIKRSGFYFGALFGVVQMIIWVFFKGWWLLPLGGLFVGYATNWLALKIIFEPIEPKRVGPFVFQGVFLKRQNNVAVEYSAIVTKQILNPANILDAILRGPASDQVFRILQTNVKKTVDKQASVTKPFVLFLVGTKEYVAMKNRVCDKLMEEIPKSIKYVYSYAEKVWDIENLLRTNMRKLPPKDFEQILHPIFQEDEWILILVGAMLGFCAGLFQLFFVFS